MESKSKEIVEYFILLTIVIIVALVVVGLLSDVPGFSNKDKYESNDYFWKSQDIAILSGQIVGENAKITLRNNKRESIVINDMTISDNLINNQLPINLNTGQVVEITLIVPNCESGEAFSHEININYETPSNKNLTFNPSVNWEGLCG